MRMGPFSNSEIIELLNRYFVATHIANEDYDAGKMGSDQRNLLTVIRRSANRQGLPSGRVQIYLVDRDTKVLEVLPLKRALDTKTFLSTVKGWVKKYHLVPRERPLPTKRASCQEHDSSQLLLRIAARYKTLDKITTEDQLVLEQEEWQQFISIDQAVSEWSVDDDLAKKILIHVYPYAQNFDLNLEQIKDVELRASVLRRDGGVSIVALVGRLSMSHVMYVTKGRQEIHTDLVGYAVSSPEGKPIIKLSTSGAKYGSFHFDALIESVSWHSSDTEAQ